MKRKYIPSIYSANDQIGKLAGLGHFRGSPLVMSRDIK